MSTMKFDFHFSFSSLVFVSAVVIAVSQNAATASLETLEDFSDTSDSVQWEYQDYSTLSRNATRCSRTELSLGKESLLHTWKIKGLAKYVNHVKNFNETFDAITEEVNFKSETVDGKWVFRISKSLIPGRSNPELRISSAYSYEAREQKKIHFGILLTVTQCDREIVHPVVKSTKPVVIQPQPRTKAMLRGVSQSTLPLEYVYNFSWADIFSEFEKNLSSGDWDDDLTLVFGITAFFPNVSISSSPEPCNEAETAEFLKGKVPLAPPFWKHGNSMLNDDRYSDLVIRVGTEGFHAHRIILAASSPVFSSILYNKSMLQGTNETVTTLEISADHTPKAVEEMLRYVYTGMVESLPELANKLILLAYQYQLLELKRLCEISILARITPSTAVDTYGLGREVMSSKLTTKAFNVMRTSKRTVVSQADEFRNMTFKYPNLMLELFLSS